MPLISKGQKLRPSNRHKVTIGPKVADQIYSDPRFKAFRTTVCRRAGYRCEYVDPATQLRCRKAAPEHRVVADHIVELKDGGDPFDPSNGQCHCVEHNTRKGVTARAARRQGEGG
jgi:5-methylcytosine-specific restriction enzyme A